ncbi:MAG: UTP--glucose-1-phosphate uridylyltransferase GalU [bacterium]
MKIRKAVIPVAGLGTRFLPATKVVPKELLPVVDRPSIHYIVEEAVSSGIEEIVLVTGRGKQHIMDYFDRAPELEEILSKRGKEDLLQSIQKTSSMAEFVTVLQPQPLGLGHAVLCAKDVIGDEPFFVCLPDDLIDSDVPCMAQMLQVYQKREKPVIAVERVPDDQVNQYGILQSKEVDKGLHRIENLVEKPELKKAPSNLGIVGRYLLPSQIFKILEQVKPGTSGEIQLTDGLRQLASQSDAYGFEFSGTRYDTGDKLGFLKANLAYGLKRGHFNGCLKEFMRSLLE